MIDLTKDHEKASFPSRFSDGLKPADVQTAFRVKHEDGSQTNVSCSWEDTLRPKTRIGLLRHYNPVTGRWLSRDPLEEHGGLNLYGFVGNDSVFQTDASGLDINPSQPGGTWYLAFVVDWEFWNKGIFAYASAYFELARTAMLHADGTLQDNWDLNSNEIDKVKATATYTRYIETRLKSQIRFAFIGKPDGSYNWKSREENMTFDYGTDGYYAFGDARFSTDGSLNLCSKKIDYYATVTMSDRFVFRGYANAPGLSPTGVGYRLETHGWISPFSTHAGWKETVKLDLGL